MIQTRPRGPGLGVLGLLSTSLGLTLMRLPMMLLLVTGPVIGMDLTRRFFEGQFIPGALLSGTAAADLPPVMSLLFLIWIATEIAWLALMIALVVRATASQGPEPVLARGAGPLLRDVVIMLPAILILGVIMTVATVLGLIIFILPGLYLLGRYLPLMAVIVVERRFWGASARAHGLTKGHRWALAGGALILLVVLAVLSLGLSAGWVWLHVSTPLANLGAQGPVSRLFFGIASSALQVGMVGTYATMVYTRLVQITDGATPDVLQKVFQ